MYARTANSDDVFRVGELIAMLRYVKPRLECNAPKLSSIYSVLEINIGIICGAMIYLPAFLRKHPISSYGLHLLKSKFKSTWPDRTFWTTRRYSPTVPSKSQNVESSCSLRRSVSTTDRYTNGLADCHIPSPSIGPLENIHNRENRSSVECQADQQFSLNSTRS